MEGINMKVKENVTIYECDFCKKNYRVKTACEKHENFCYKNPTNTPKCSGCNHLEEYQKEIWYDTFGGERMMKRKAFRCKAQGIGLYPLKVLRGDMLNRYPETFADEILMPNKCDFFKDYNFE
jgi:hypothetical protein